jgi:hypothetical protein
MPSLLEKALERVRTWPKSRQDELARMALDMDEQGTTPLTLTDDERLDLQAAWQESEAGDFATDQEVKAAYRRFSP